MSLRYPANLLGVVAEWTSGVGPRGPVALQSNMVIWSDCWLVVSGRSYESWKLAEHPSGSAYAAVSCEGIQHTLARALCEK